MTHEDVVTPEMVTAGLDWVCAPKTRDDEAAIEAKPEVIVSSDLLMRASDLIDRLATALSARGDGR